MKDIIRLDPIAYSVRGYPDKVDTSIPLHEVNDPYIANATVVVFSNGHVSLENLKELPDQRHFWRLKQRLKDLGYKVMHFQHNGKHRTIYL